MWGHGGLRPRSQCSIIFNVLQLTNSVWSTTQGLRNHAPTYPSLRSVEPHCTSEVGHEQTSFPMLYAFFWVSPGVWILYADVSEHSVCSIFIGLSRWNKECIPKCWHIKFRSRELPRRKQTTIRTWRKFEIKSFPTFQQNSGHFTWRPTYVSLLSATKIHHKSIVVRHSIFLYTCQWHTAQQYTQIALSCIHDNNAYVKVPQRCVKRALPILLTAMPDATRPYTIGFKGSV